MNTINNFSSTKTICLALLWGWQAFFIVVIASPFYQYDVIAQTGKTPLGAGGPITSINRGVSINDHGIVALTAAIPLPGQPSAGQVLIGDGTKSLRLTALSQSTNRRFSSVQINNLNQVVTNDRSGNATFIHIWDIADTRVPRVPRVVADGQSGNGSRDFDAVVSSPSINNNGEVVFPALTAHGSAPFFVSQDCPNECLVTEAVEAVIFPKFNTQSFPGSPPILRPMIADNGLIVVRAGDLPSDPIVAYDKNNSFQEIAKTVNTFSVLGRSPGISDSGEIIAFVGNRGNGLGVFIAYRTATAFSSAILVAGENNLKPQAAELGYDNGINDDGVNPRSIYFKQFDINSRVAVTHIPLGDPAEGLEDDSVVVSFIATPNQASRDNPAATGTPLLFSGAIGLWTVRMDFLRERAAPGTLRSLFKIQKNSPIPVVQVGDKIFNGVVPHVVDDIGVQDPLANVSGPLGFTRTQRLGDHQMAFWIRSGTEELVVKATHLDSDQDGLLDHWEEFGGGIDMDQDGLVDLALSYLGADPFKRDLFLEIDWLTPRTTGVPISYSHEPPAYLTWSLAKFYSSRVPALQGIRYGYVIGGLPPADIPAGIIAHIDAGKGLDTAGKKYSQNIPKKFQEGGDLIAKPCLFSSCPHLDLVYMTSRDLALESQSGLTARSFHEIKDNFFGRKDKRSRELAFHYAVLADFHTKNFDDVVRTSNDSGLTITNDILIPTDFVGDVILITSGSGAGQMKEISSNTANSITVSSNWDIPLSPGDKFVVLSGSTGIAEIDTDVADVRFGRPGNDLTVTMGGFGVRGDLANLTKIIANANAAFQIIIHELGHTLTLRHGGVDDKTCGSLTESCMADFKVNYLSTMNYAYLFDTSVFNYAKQGDEVFEDWLNLRFDFSNSLHLVGNSFRKGLNGAPIQATPQKEMTPLEIERIFGPLDLTYPSVQINTPLAGTVLVGGTDVTIIVTASDDVGIDNIEIALDLNGNGDDEEPAEQFQAIEVGPNTYQAVIPSLNGPDGDRLIRAFATDLSGNMEVDVVPVTMTSGVIIVPDVINSTETAAKVQLTTAGFMVISVTTTNSSTVAAGLVISQIPAAGTIVASASTAQIVVSSGPAPIPIPNVVGSAQAVAEAAITSAGLTVGTITTANSATVAVGDVISQTPLAGTNVVPGSTVDLMVSSGPAPVPVPSVVGSAQAVAEAEITSAGLTVGTITITNSNTVAAGNVISQTPPAGTNVVPGSTVDLVISSGPAPIPVPSVVGSAQAVAEAAITSAGLTVGAITTASSATVVVGDVISQTPLAGTNVVPGSAVDLVVSSGPALIPVPSVVGSVQAIAETAITNAGLTVGTITTANSSTVTAGNVISQTPIAGTNVVSGSAVDLVVSLGPVIPLEPSKCDPSSFDPEHIFIGTDGNDELKGTNGNDLIDGRGGDDKIESGDGDDCIIGGPGDDKIEAGSGNDTIFAGDGNDKVEAGDGDDTIDGGNGFDLIKGGDGTDTCLNGEKTEGCEIGVDVDNEDDQDEDEDEDEEGHHQGDEISSDKK